MTPDDVPSGLTPGGPISSDKGQREDTVEQRVTPSGTAPPTVDAATRWAPPPAGGAAAAGGEAAGHASPAIPGYEVQGVLGHGGMGVVYKARHVKLNRTVALKMVLAGDRARPEELVRFLCEGELIAQLNHENIVKIYEVGEDGSRPYFCLEYLEGGSLADRLQATGMRPREAAALIETVASAVHAAHLQGVIHRDLKPANVLLTADGTPKITDFGLAKRLHDGRGLTVSGAILGTPAYMSPEQARGERAGATVLADVYSLGAILYELITGRPPFQADTPMGTLLEVLERAPVPPQVVNPGVDVDLATICMKCLAKEPGQRYPSALALAEELARWAAGEPIRARPPRLLTLARSLARRYARPGAWLVGVGVLVGLVAGLHTFTTDVQLPLHANARAFDALPSAPRPWLASIGPLPGWCQGAAAIGLFLGMGSLGLLAVVRVRPQHTASDVGVGLAVGGVAGITALSFGTGWALIYGTTLSGQFESPEYRTLVEVGLQDPDRLAGEPPPMITDEFGRPTPGLPPGWQVERYPELRGVPRAEQTALLHQKLRADLMVGVQTGIWYSLFAVGGFLLLGAAEGAVAGGLVRRHGLTGAMFGGYAELVSPGVVSLYAGLNLAVNLLAGRPTFRPETWGTVFALAVAALIAASCRWPLWVRLVLQASWVVAVAAVFSGIWAPHTP